MQVAFTRLQLYTKGRPTSVGRPVSLGVHSLEYRLDMYGVRHCEL